MARMFVTLISSSVLVFALCAMYVYRHKLLHPAFWTNAGFIGYAISGIYFGFMGYDSARFLNEAGIGEREFWFKIATSIVLFSLLSLNFGFAIGNRIELIGMSVSFKRGKISLFARQLGMAVSVLLMLIGLVYFLYFSDQLAGGVLAMFWQMGAFSHLLTNTPISTLPFNFLYGGALLWLLLWLGERRPWIGLAFIPLGMFVVLSTGRISIAFAYGTSAILAYIFVVYGRVNWRVCLVGILTLFSAACAVYFWRVYTSYVYSGRIKEYPIAEAKEQFSNQIGFVLQYLIGRGNLPDLQQIILVVRGLGDEKLQLELGATYFDWVNNFLGSRIGEGDDPVQSVGHRIKDVYFPDISGVPAPGMITEAILNFGFFAPIALIFIAALVTAIYRCVERSSSAFNVLVYCIFLITVWALSVKVDSTALRGLIWTAGPITLAWISIIFFNRLFQFIASSEVKN